MFCSTIIPTIGRSSLARSVASVLEQNFSEDDFEVIVVNDSGQPLPEEDWQKSDRVQIIHTNRHKISVARNTGAAIAQARYLHFLDDDDWLLPNSLEKFWTLSQQAKDAVWLYGGVEFVDAVGKPLGKLNLKMNGNCAIQIISGAWIPMQPSLVQTKMFFEVGGFNPLFGPTEEIELGGRMALKGDFANISETVVNILRGEGWDTSVDYSVTTEYNRWARDIALSQPNVFSRMHASANSGYWYGRITKTYLSTMFWNWRHRKLSAAASRAMFGMLSIMLAGRYALSKKFWKAIKDDHVPGSAFLAFEE